MTTANKLLGADASQVPNARPGDVDLRHLLNAAWLCRVPPSAQADRVATEPEEVARIAGHVSEIGLGWLGIQPAKPAAQDGGSGSRRRRNEVTGDGLEPAEHNGTDPDEDLATLLARDAEGSDDPALHGSLAELLLEQGDALAAVAATDRGLRFAGPDARLLATRGRALDALGREEEALAALDWALDLDPDLVAARSRPVHQPGAARSHGGVPRGA